MAETVPTTRRRPNAQSANRRGSGVHDDSSNRKNEEEPQRRRSSLSSVHSHSRKDRDLPREGDHLHHSSAAERRTAYSRTREHRERRVLEHSRTKSVAASEAAADKSCSDASSARHTYLSGRRSILDDDSHVGPSSRSVNREARGRRERLAAEPSDLDNNLSSSLARRHRRFCTNFAGGHGDPLGADR